MKKRPMPEDETYFRYKDLVESWIDFIGNIHDIKIDELHDMVSSLAKEIYDRGYDDACAIIGEVHEEEILN